MDDQVLSKFSRIGAVAAALFFPLPASAGGPFTFKANAGCRRREGSNNWFTSLSKHRLGLGRALCRYIGATFHRDRCLLCGV